MGKKKKSCLTLSVLLAICMISGCVGDITTTPTSTGGGNIEEMDVNSNENPEEVTI